MSQRRQSSRSAAREREHRAAALLADIFQAAGWQVDLKPREDHVRADLLARRQGAAYAVELKASAEGRPDRLIPLLAQALLEASRGAGRGVRPLAVVAAPRVAPRAVKQILSFAADHAPDAAVGVLDFRGLRVFKGPDLDELSAPLPYPPALATRSRPEPGQLLTDLNQWMLKVLLAPELPESLLSAPRGQYRNASELARAARVSVMTAHRFVQLLKSEGFLHESDPYFKLVRRATLFARWQAWAHRSATEEPMRFVIRGDPRAQILEILSKDARACLALFAAADALKLGLVEGVPPHVYVEPLPGANRVPWKELRPCAPGEPPDLILRKPPASESVFRGMVKRGQLVASDVFQVWVDVWAHPARGQEQADLILNRVLRPVIQAEV